MDEESHLFILFIMFLWDVIIHPCPNFAGTEMKAMNKCITYFQMGGMTYTCHTSALPWVNHKPCWTILINKLGFKHGLSNAGPWSHRKIVLKIHHHAWSVRPIIHVFLWKHAMSLWHHLVKIHTVTSRNTWMHFMRKIESDNGDSQHFKQLKQDEKYYILFVSIVATPLAAIMDDRHVGQTVTAEGREHHQRES